MLQQYCAWPTFSYYRVLYLLLRQALFLQECHTERVVDDDTEVYYNSGCMKVPVSQCQLNIRLATPVYSNSAVIAGWLQSTRAQN